MIDDVTTGALTDLLLHKLPPAQAAPLEDAIVQNGEVADLLELAMYDLVDDYAAGRLSPEDARRVEEHLLATPEARARLAFSRALRRHQVKRAVSPMQRFSRHSQPRALAGALAAVVLMIVVLAVVSGRIRTPDRGTDPAKSRPTLPGTPATLPVAGAPTQHANPNSTFTVALLSSQTRGAMQPSVVIPSGVSVVRLQCEVPRRGAESPYRATLIDGRGNMLLSVDGLHPKQIDGISFLEANIAVEPMSPGHYRLSVYSGTGADIALVAREFDVQAPVP